MTEIRNPAPDLYTAGQPSPEQLAELARQGVRTVVNLRAPTEPVAYDESAIAHDLGLRYVSLPVSGPQDLTPQLVARFSEELDAARGHGAVLVHCASANRVGAVLALDEAWVRGAERDHAIALGRRAGLTTLEPAVESLIK